MGKDWNWVGIFIPPTKRNLRNYYKDENNNWYWEDMYSKSRILNPENTSMQLFDWARYEPGQGNHQERERVGRSGECVYCKCLRMQHNINNPKDKLATFAVYLMKNGQRVKGNVCKNTK